MVDFLYRFIFYSTYEKPTSPSNCIFNEPKLNANSTSHTEEAKSGNEKDSNFVGKDRVRPKSAIVSATVSSSSSSASTTSSSSSSAANSAAASFAGSLCTSPQENLPFGWEKHEGRLSHVDVVKYCEQLLLFDLENFAGPVIYQKSCALCSEVISWK